MNNYQTIVATSIALEIDSAKTWLIAANDNEEVRNISHARILAAERIARNIARNMTQKQLFLAACGVTSCQ